MRLNVGLFSLFLVVFVVTLSLLFLPPQLSAVNLDDPVFVLGETVITKGDIVTVFSVFSGAGSIVSFIYLVATSKKR